MEEDASMADLLKELFEKREKERNSQGEDPRTFKRTSGKVASSGEAKGK